MRLRLALKKKIAFGFCIVVEKGENVVGSSNNVIYGEILFFVFIKYK